jgi:hypothetical protein
MITSQIRSFSILTLVVALSLSFIACEKDEEEAFASFDCSGENPTYTSSVKSLLDNRCATSGCHSSSTKAGGIDLSNYMAAETESERARFLGAVNQLSSYEPMPRGGAKLSDDNIKTLTCWVDNGSPE